MGLKKKKKKIFSTKQTPLNFHMMGVEGELLFSTFGHVFFFTKMAFLRGQHYVPRFLCSPIPMFPEPIFPGTYVSRCHGLSAHPV